MTYTVKADKQALEEYLAEKAEAVNTTGENTASDTTGDAAQTETGIDDTATAKTDSKVSEKKEEANKDSSSASEKEEQKETSNDQKVESDKKQDAEKKDQKSDNTQEAAKKEESKQETDKNDNDKKNKTDSEKSEVKEDQKSDAKTDTQKPEEKKDETVDIKVDTTITVVDKNKADELANKGEVVWKDNNETVPKTDGTAVEEKVETPSSTEEKPAETTGTADTKQPEKGNPKQDTKPAASANQSTQESNPPKQTHTHNYNIPITKTVHHDPTGHNEPVYKTVTDYQDQAVYETKVVCGCGAIFDNTQQWDQHSIDGCIYGYSVKRVQTGTQRVAVGTHQEQTGTRWVPDSAAWDETVTTGYKCSCGATK